MLLYTFQSDRSMSHLEREIVMCLFVCFVRFLPSFFDRIHRGREILISTSKPAVPNKIVESNTNRSRVAIDQLNLHP